MASLKLHLSLGRFPENHMDPNLRNQLRFVVLKVNENYSSQMPSCWTNGKDPRFRQNLPPTHDRLQQVEGIWSVKQYPHCDKVWQRDVNACRYLISYLVTLRNIALIFHSLQENNTRPPYFGAPKEGEVLVQNSQVV